MTANTPDDLAEKRAVVDPRAEYQAFTAWAANWLPHIETPEPTSHLFGAWMGSARHRRASTRLRGDAGREGKYLAKEGSDGIWHVWDVSHQAECNHFIMATIDSSGAADDLHEKWANRIAAALATPAPSASIGDVAQLRAALEPFAAVAELDIAQEEGDGDRFRPMSSHNYAPILTVGDLRRAYDALRPDAGSEERGDA